MKKFLKTVFVLILIVIGAVMVALDNFAGPKIKEIVEVKGSQVLQGKVSVGSVDVSLWPPVTIDLYGVNIEKSVSPEVHGTIPHATVSLDFSDLWDKHVLMAVVNIKNPVVNVNMPPITTATTAPVEAAGAPVGTISIPLGLHLRLENGKGSLTQNKKTLNVSDLKMDFVAPSLKGVWGLKGATQAHLEAPGFSTTLPLTLNSRFQFLNGVVQTSDTQISVSGLQINLSGKADLPREEHHWEFSVNVPDLGRLDVPPAFLPPGKWTGSVEGQGHLEHQIGEEWTGGGHLAVKDLKGKEINLKRRDVAVSGSMGAWANLDFQYRKTLKIDKFEAGGDFRDLQVSETNIFEKPVGVPLDFTIKGQGDNGQWHVDHLDAHLAQIQANATGTLASEAGQISDLRITIPRTRLAGLEKIFPPLNRSPLMGTVELNGKVHGDLSHPDSLDLSVSPLTLDKVAGEVHWMSGDKEKSADGKVTLNAHGLLVAKGNDLVTAVANGRLDLTALKIDVKDRFEKPQGTPLALDFSAKKKGKLIVISNSVLRSTAGKMNLSGTVEQPQQPKLNLNLKMGPLNLAALSTLSPAMAPWHLAGRLSAGLNVKGDYDFKQGLAGSPLALTGQVSALIPQLVYDPPSKESAAKTADAPDKGKSGPEKAEEASSYLPSWPLFKNMKLTSLIKIAKADFKNLPLTGMDWKGMISEGELKGTARIQKIFNGQIITQDVHADLLKKGAPVHMQIRMKNIDMAPAVAWTNPQWKDLIKGLATGFVNVDLAPSATQAAGYVKIADGLISTLPFDEMINQKLAELKVGTADVPVNSTGAKGDMEAQFIFSKLKLQFQKLFILTPEKNELDAAGWVDTEKSLELNGRVHLSHVDPQIRAGNSDSQGRFVVPVTFTGTVLKPEVNLMGGTLKELVANRASYEFQRGKNQVQTQVKNVIQKGIDSGNVKLPDDVKNKLKNILGN